MNGVGEPEPRVEVTASSGGPDIWISVGPTWSRLTQDEAVALAYRILETVTTHPMKGVKNDG